MSTKIIGVELTTTLAPQRWISKSDSKRLLSRAQSQLRFTRSLGELRVLNAEAKVLELRIKEVSQSLLVMVVESSDNGIDYSQAMGGDVLVEEFSSGNSSMMS